MKMTKKKVFVIALAVCALAILSMGTLAWFNAATEVTNKFAVSGENFTPDFSIEVTETKVDVDGKPVDADGDGVIDTTTTGNEYTTVAPGDVLLKDPVVKNTGAYSQWVRVNITISKGFADKVATVDQKKATAKDLNMEALFDGFDYDLYDNMEFYEGFTDYYVYTYYYKDNLIPTASFKVFDKILIPSIFTQEDMTYLNFNVNVKAEAIQSDNIAGPAKAAFDSANWEVCTAYDFGKNP